jgi:UDP-N-acetylmuramoyl-L-alanyl-D-glutamate--2,6-diaminopimelate ligase
MNKLKLLNDLVRSVIPDFYELPKNVVKGLASDSRKVQQGYIFFALTGGNTDGHNYIRHAIQSGASAIIGTREMNDLPIPYIQVSDGRMALARFASAYNDFPSQKMVMIGVTGTDGKTTTCNLIYRILETAGYKTGIISTVNAIIGKDIVDTGFHVTTPEALELQEYLGKMVAAGITHAIVETTSHGLEQKRVAACNFDFGVITNITHEHLDYHGSFETYRSAKGILFRGLSDTPIKGFLHEKGAVLNRDDLSFDYLAGITQVNQISYGIDPRSDIQASHISQSSTGLSFNVSIRLPRKTSTFRVETPLSGLYNVSNCLAALSITTGFLNIQIEEALRGITRVTTIPGRMEIIDLGQNFRAIVDFAHTPNALKKVLTSLRNELNTQKNKGKIIAVFGSAGLRDRQKRRLMAEISAELSDLTVLTAEDPRTEDLSVILEEMSAGVQSRGGIEGKTYWKIPDRGEAICLSIELAKPGDIIVVCGKGHEQSMCFGEIEYPWDDRIALRAAIAHHIGIPGPEIPYLPTHSH